MAFSLRHCHCRSTMAIGLLAMVVTGKGLAPRRKISDTTMNSLPAYQRRDVFANEVFQIQTDRLARVLKAKKNVARKTKSKDKSKSGKSSKSKGANRSKHSDKPSKSHTSHTTNNSEEAKKSKHSNRSKSREASKSGQGSKSEQSKKSTRSDKKSNKTSKSKTSSDSEAQSGKSNKSKRSNKSKKSGEATSAESKSSKFKSGNLESDSRDEAREESIEEDLKSRTASPTPLPSNVDSGHRVVDKAALPTTQQSETTTVAPTWPLTTAPTLPIPCTPTPTVVPSAAPSPLPTIAPTWPLTKGPTLPPTYSPTVMTSDEPSLLPTYIPTVPSSDHPSLLPTIAPTWPLTKAPTLPPTYSPTILRSDEPSPLPTTLQTPNWEELITICRCDENKSCIDDIPLAQGRGLRMCFLSKDDNIQSLEVNDLQLEKDQPSVGTDFVVVLVRDDSRVVSLENQAVTMCYRNDCVVNAPMPSEFFEAGRRSTIVARGSVSIQQFEKLSYERIGDGRVLRGALRNLAGALVVGFEKSVELDVATQVESKLDNPGEYDGPLIEGRPQDDSPRARRLGLALGMIALAALVGGALLSYFRDKGVQTETELGFTDDALSTE